MNRADSPNNIKIKKIGIISRDYRERDENGFRDFSHTFKNILLRLNKEGCDSALFSLYTLVKREELDVIQVLNHLEIDNIKAVFIAEFEDGIERMSGDYVIYFRDKGEWQTYRLVQKFGSLKYTQSFNRQVIEPFKAEVKSQRLLGNCTLLLSGESNIVKFSQANERVEDPFKYFDQLNSDIKIILNPAHERMMRFEVNLKRKFLSKNGRWLISVWNKGKADKNGHVKNGNKPAWAIFYNGEERQVKPIEESLSTPLNIEMGIVDLAQY